MRRRSRGPLPRRLLPPDVEKVIPNVPEGDVEMINSQIEDLVTSRKLLAALEHAKRVKKNARYQTLRNEASQVDSKYLYADGFLPGVFFYKYLASVADVGGDKKEPQYDEKADGELSDEIPLKTTGNPKLQLKCWLPDTVIFGGSFPPVWLYSDKTGCIRKVINFQDNHVLEKLGNRRFENDPVVVFKEPVLTKGAAGVTTSGNNIKLYNTVELKSALTKAVGSPVTFALQKYIKPRGPKAFVVRAVFRVGRPPTCWTINNKIRYDSSDETILHRFCTLTSIDESCTFAKLTERACTDVIEITQRIVRYIDTSLRIAIESLVADFIKDDLGQWWLIQVKGFRLKHVRPGCVGHLSIKIGDAYDRSAVQDEEVEHPATTATRNKHDISSTTMTDQSWKVHKLVPCKFCQVLYLQHEVSYKMTMKMMYETIARIRLRSGPDVDLRFLVQPKEDLDSGLLYQTWNVCNLCYALYERDQALLKIEQRFNVFLGCPMKVMRDGGITIIHESNVSKSQPMLTQVPTDFTLCRLMLFFTALYDIPKDLYDSETLDAHRPKRAKLYLRFSVLGFDSFVPLDTHAMVASPSLTGGQKCYWIPLNLMRCFHFFAPKTPLQSKLRETSGLGTFLADEGVITIQLIRCTDPSHVDIDPKRGLQSHPTDSPGRRQHRPALVEQGSSYSVLLGSAKVQLYQFRSSYVSKTDIYTSMSSGELFNLKANVGFERIRIVKSKHITARYNLRQYFGVYVPDTSFWSNDKLCSEWVDNMSVVSDPAAVIVPQANLDKFRYRQMPSNMRSSSSSSLIEENDDENELEALVEENGRAKVVAPTGVAPRPKFSPTRFKNEDNIADKDGDDDESTLLFSLLAKGLSDSKLSLDTVQVTPGTGTWCISIMLHRTHNWFPSVELRAGWTASYVLFNQVWEVVQREIPTRNEREMLAIDACGRMEDIVFDCTNKHYLLGTLEMLHAFYLRDRGLCEVKLTHPSAPTQFYLVDIELAGLRDCRTIDGTFNIRDTQVQSPKTNNPYPPYLSVSVYVVRLSVSEAELLSERGYVPAIDTPTPDGLIVLNKS